MSSHQKGVGSVIQIYLKHCPTQWEQSTPKFLLQICHFRWRALLLSPTVTVKINRCALDASDRSLQLRPSNVQSDDVRN